MKPSTPIDERYLARIAGGPQVEETFDSAVFFFSDDTYQEVKRQAAPMPLDPHAANILKNVRDKLRKDVTYGDIGNVEAELLGELYNPKRGASFRAYLHGKHISDLRFFMVPSGALPDIRSPEETGLVNVDTSGGHSGILYLSHLKTEKDANSAEKSGISTRPTTRSTRT